MASMGPRVNRQGVTTSWRVQVRDKSGRMHGPSFKTEAEAEEFRSLVEQLGWEAVAEMQAVATGKGGNTSLDALRQVVMSNDFTSWHIVDPLKAHAVLVSNVAIAVEWERDLEAARNRDERAYSGYAGLTREAHVVRVLFNGQPIIQETMLSVELDMKRGRTRALFVPLAQEQRGRWKADVLAFTLVKLVNDLCWRGGFGEYLESSRVAVSD